MHAGKRTDRVIAEGRVRLEAAAFGLPDATGAGAGVDPGEFLLRLLGLAAGRVDLVSQALGEAFRAEAEQAGAGAERPAGEETDAAAGEAVGPAGIAALVGHRYVLDKAGNRVPVAEAVRGLAAYEREWVELGRELAKTAIDARLVEAQTRVTEEQGRLIAEAFRRVLAALDLSEEQAARASVAVPRELRAIGGGG
jgi:hypothetical protein